MPGCRGAGVQRCRGAEVRGCRGAEVRGARVQGCRGAEVQRCRGAEVQRRGARLQGAQIHGASLAFVISTMAKNFTEIVAWQLADELRRLMLEIVAQPDVVRDFKYCDQCKDAARSAPSNIAEGFGRYRHREFAQFLRIAMGSLKEIEDLLIDGHHRGYVSCEQLKKGTELAIRSKSACAGLTKYLLRTPDRDERS